MLKPLPDSPSFRLRAACVGADGGGTSSVLRVARHAAVARTAPVLQRARPTRQLAFDFFRAGR
jgi:hypothetical protein